MADDIAKVHEKIGAEKNRASETGDIYHFSNDPAQNMVNGMQRFLSASPLGPAILPAAQGAFRKFHYDVGGGET